MKKAVIFILLLMLVLPSFSMAEDKNSELWSSMKEYLKQGIDYDQYLHVDVSSVGFKPNIVYFTFDFRKGNQGVSINIENTSFLVVTYEEGDIVPLIAFYKLLPLFNEISSGLPEEYSLLYKLYFGVCGGEYHDVEITTSNYHLFMN